VARHRRRGAQASASLSRGAAARALAPAIDQTRDVRLVVLPGAYVGLLLGGASPFGARPDPALSAQASDVRSCR
jgi:ABC-type iron transport system FetAB permease component